MKCVICKTGNLNIKNVEEEIRSKHDIALVKMDLLVCENCGERYYSRNDMLKLDQIKNKLTDKSINVKEIGKVFSIAV
jgi:YgiT-type zinc finger domain-containing protein